MTVADFGWLGTGQNRPYFAPPERTVQPGVYQEDENFSARL